MTDPFDFMFLLLSVKQSHASREVDVATVTSTQI